MYFKCMLSDLFKDLTEEFGVDCKINDLGSMIGKPILIDEKVVGSIKNINLETNEALIFIFRKPSWEVVLDEEKNIKSLEVLSLDFPKVEVDVSMSECQLYTEGEKASIKVEEK